jgi:hypothetical protein
MTVIQYNPSDTMRQARTQYFDANKFGDNGGYDDVWVDFKLGPIPFPIPNAPARVRAVKVHDMHHILTGYDTNLRGEIEISAWEIGAGCKDFTAAWVLNLSGLGIWWLWPRRIFSAFVRGLRSQSLYGRELDALLEQTVSATREQMHVPPGPSPLKLSDFLLFALSVLAGTAIGLIFLCFTLPLLPVGLWMQWKKKQHDNSVATSAK